MNDIINVFGGISLKDLLLIVIAVVAIIKYARTGYQKIAEYHDKEQEKESLRNLVRENSKQIEELKNLVLKNMESDREYKLRSLSDKLFVCYNSAKMQGFITPRQLENFYANLDVYKELGGNGVVERKYAPEVAKMEVKEFDANTLSELVSRQNRELEEEEE